MNYGFYLGCDGKNFEDINKVDGIPGVYVDISNFSDKEGISSELLEGN